jgi:hypothetical protein
MYRRVCSREESIASSLQLFKKNNNICTYLNFYKGSLTKMMWSLLIDIHTIFFLLIVLIISNE